MNLNLQSPHILQIVLKSLIRRIEGIQYRARQSQKLRHWLRNPLDIWTKSARNFHALGQSLIVAFLTLKNFGRSLKCHSIGLNNQEQLLPGSQLYQLRHCTTPHALKNMSKPQIEGSKAQHYSQVCNQSSNLKKTLTFVVHERLCQRLCLAVSEFN